MFKIVLCFSSIMVSACSAWAQVYKCPDMEIVISDSVYNVQDSSIFEAVEMNYYLAFDSFLYSYLEIDDNVSCFLDYINNSGFFNEDFVRYVEKNKSCTQIFQNDSTSTMLLGNGEISITICNPINCNPSVEGYHHRSMVKIFDSKGQLSDKDKLYKAFSRQRKLFYRQHTMHNVQFKHYFSDETNSERVVVVIYCFDYNSGLSLITACQKYHSLKQNDYIHSLTEFVDSFCRKHYLSKIIFSGLLSNE